MPQCHGSAAGPALRVATRALQFGADSGTSGTSCNRMPWGLEVIAIKVTTRYGQYACQGQGECNSIYGLDP